MSNLSNSIARGLSANAFGQIVGILTQVVQFPVLLSLYGVNLAGEWLLLSSIPAYIALSDIGISNVAANAICMSVASGALDKAREVLHSLCRFIVAVSILMFGIVIAVAFLADWSSLLGFTVIDSLSASLIIAVLSIGAVVSLSSGVFYGVYRGCGFGVRIITMMNLGRLVDLVALICVWLLELNPLQFALILFSLRVIFIVILMMDSARICSKLPLGFRLGSWLNVRDLMRPAISFMMFPIGNAFYFQGLSFVVNATMGAPGVVVYNICRVVSRLVPMVTQVLRQTLWLEYPGLFATNQFAHIRRIQRSAAGLTWLLILLSLIFFLILGPEIVAVWTAGAVEVDRLLLLLFALVAALNAMWNMNSTILISTNSHEKFAVIYLISVTSAVAVSFYFSRILGLYGIGLILVVSELPLLFYATVRAISLAKDSLVEFVDDVFFMRSIATLFGRFIKK